MLGQKIRYLKVLTGGHALADKTMYMRPVNESAIEASSIYTGSAKYGIYINNVFTYTTSGVHKGIRSTVTYTPGLTGYATPIAIVGQVVLTTGNTFTGGQGAMYGVQGQIDLPSGAILNNSSSIFAALRGVITGAPTCTNFSVLAGLYIDNLSSGILTGGQYGSCLAALTNHGLAIDHAIFIYGAFAGNAITNLLSIQGTPTFVSGGAASGTSRRLAILIGATTYYINVYQA